VPLLGASAQTKTPPSGGVSAEASNKLESSIPAFAGGCKGVRAMRERHYIT